VERLWTPWRSEYVTGKGPKSACFLCDIVADPKGEAAELLVGRTDTTITVLNKFPYNTGHLVVAPHQHSGELSDLSAELRAALMEETSRAVKALRQAMEPHGFNIGLNLGAVAGAGLPDHLHVHVVPRWGGDTNFMPIVGDTKVLPETLDQTAAKLRPLLAGD
jgi:ATP adenylyltransferase